MHIAITRFPAVPAERDKDFRDWFARSNEQLRAVVGLRGRRLMRGPDGSYTAMVEHDSAGSFAEMHKAEAISMIHHGLGGFSARVGKRRVMTSSCISPLPKHSLVTPTEHAGASHSDRGPFGLA